MKFKEYEALSELATKNHAKEVEDHLTYMNVNAVEIGASLVREQFKARHNQHRQEEKIKEEEGTPNNVSAIDDQVQALGQWQVVQPK